MTCFWIGYISLSFFAVVPSIPCSRLALISKVIHPQQVIHSVVHAVMGMLVAWCAAVMTKGKFLFLSVPCTASERWALLISELFVKVYNFTWKEIM